MIKLETIRYLLSLTGKEKSRIWKKKSKVYIYIDHWITPKYYLLNALYRNGYTTKETSEKLVFEIIK